VLRSRGSSNYSTPGANNRNATGSRLSAHTMNGQVTPQFVQAILEWQWTWPIARFALVMYYLVSGLGKIANFRGAIVEMAEAGMPVPVVMALLSIFVELTGSVLVLIDRWVWLGAGMLGVFTAIGAVTAHAFWKMSGRARIEAIAVFLMHIGLIAAFVLCALLTEREGPVAHVAASSVTSQPQVQIVGG
jgi:uncharacterized membrane protein YphA (DoxX/SURF4 family)